MTGLGAEEIRALFGRFADRFAAEKEALIALDGKVGDSDLGLTMAKGFAAARDAVAASEADAPGALMKAAGGAIAKAAPSTMGTLMATGFLRGGKALEEAAAIDTEALAGFWRAFAEGVAQRGKASRGDKTVLDVLLPIAEALEEADPLPEAVAKARIAAAEALEATRDMVAQHGKAAAFQEKSRGVQDAGSTVALMLIEEVEAQIAAG